MALVVEERDAQIVVANNALHFTFNLREGRFSLRRPGAERPALLNATAQAVYRAGGRTTTASMEAGGQIVWRDAPGHDPHGAGHHLLFYWTGADARLALTAVLYEDLPFMLLRLALAHRDPKAWQVESLLPLTVASGRGESGLWLPDAASDVAFFRNGWASGSPAVVAHFGEPPLDGQFVRQARTAFLNAATPPGSKHELWSEAFTVLGRPGAAGLVAGFVSLGDQFGAIGAQYAPGGRNAAEASAGLQLVCQCDGISLQADTSLGSEWAYLQWADPAEPDVLGAYVLAAARQMEVRVPQRGPAGWTAAPGFGQRLDEADLAGQLNALAHLRETVPVELVQIGSGYADIPGDWAQVSSTRFPHGLPWLAQQIRQQGCTPAAWLAPFVTHADALVAVDHADWLLRDAGQHTVVAGSLGGVPVYALDVTHPEVLQWLAEVVGRLRRDWGFPCLELDMLHAGALAGDHRDSGLTRAQALRRALMVIREAAGPDTFLIGSSCPLGPAVGVLNAVRIAPDAGSDWFTHAEPWASLFKPGTAMPGRRNALRNTLTRSVLHRRWWLNDPGPLAFTEADAEPSGVEEARTLATVAGLSGGLLVFGGDPQALWPVQRALVAPLFPHSPESALAADLLEREMPERYVLHVERPWGRWNVAAVFNWDDGPRDLTIDRASLGVAGDGPLHLYDFWGGQYHRLTGHEFLVPQVPPHGVRVYGVRPLVPGPHLVATSFHISQGAELTAWDTWPGKVTFALALGRRAEGEVLMWSPSPPRGATCAGRAIEVVALGGGVSALCFEVDKTAQVEVVLS